MIKQHIIDKARRTNLGEYLQGIGEPIKKDGSSGWYRHKTHNSLVFLKGLYYWNSRSENGNAIDYLTRYMGMDFETAVTALVGFVPAPSEKEKEIAEKTKKDLVLANDYRRAFAYLQKSRGISPGLIQELIKSGHLKQEAKTNNAVFVMYDENNERVGAELEGTLSDRRFKGVESGSKYGYGFNLRYPKSADIYNYCLFFESAIDLLSFVDLKTSHHRKSFDSCILVSMVGLKINVLEHMCKTFNGLPVICVDNDTAADEFIATVDSKSENFLPYRVHRPDKQYKDWNEQLQATQKK